MIASFFTQCATIASRCIEREVITVEEVEESSFGLRMGLTGAVLFYALVRSIEDDAAAKRKQEALVLANGTLVTKEGIPPGLSGLLASLLELKDELSGGISMAEREYVCVCLMRAPHEGIAQDRRSVKSNSDRAT